MHVGIDGAIFSIDSAVSKKGFSLTGTPFAKVL